MKPRNAALLFFATAAALSTSVLLGAPRRAHALPRLSPFGSSAGRAFAPGDAATSGTSKTWFSAAPAGRSMAQAASPPPVAPTSVPASPPPGAACTTDEQCPANTICERGTCRPFERAVNVLLFRKEGGYTHLLPFYFSQRGSTGYRIVAPLYWHFWSPDSKSRIVAPFYWRFEDHAKRRFVTVVGLWSQTVQPDARSWALWPLIYKSTKFGWAAPLLLSFKIQNPDEARAFGLYALLYYWSRNHATGAALDLFVPLFVSKRSPARAFTWALPLTFYWRGGETKHLLAVPLFYWDRGPKGGTLITPLGYRSRSGNNQRGSVAWLYWFGRQGGRAYDVGFPLVWSFRSPESSTTVAANVVHLRRPTWSLSTAFPLYWRARDFTKGSSWQLLAPVFFSRRGEGNRTFSWITPLGGYRRDEETGTRTLATVVPPLVFRRDRQSELDMALLLYWRHRDLGSGATTRLIGNVYLRRDPAGSTSVVFPLFWHFRDAASGATAHSFLPFYFRRRSPDETLTAGGVFPVWLYHRRFAEGGYSAGLLPLAFFGSRPEAGHGIVFPLFWHFRDAQRTSTVAAPVFYRFADRQSSAAGVPPLLYFQGHDAGSSYKVQVPLFWRFTNERAGTRTTVLPVGFFQSKRDGWSGGLFPLLFAGKTATKGHFVLFPLVWRFTDDERHRSTTLVANYLRRREGDQVTDALLPLVYYRRGAKPGGVDERSFTLFPLVHYRRDARGAVFVSPVAAWSRNERRKVGAVGPFFWWDGPQVAAKGLLPPLYLDITRKETGVRTRIFGPWVQTDGPEAWSRVLFPLYGRYGDRKETGTWVFPTFFRRRTEAGYALDTAFPLFWWGRSPGYSALQVGPWFRRSGPGWRSTGVVPLFFYGNSTERRLFVAPLVYHRRDHAAGTSRTLGLPLVYQSTNPDGHRTVVLPLWFSGRHKARSHAVLFPIAWHFANDEERSSANLVGPFYWARKGSYRIRGLMPVAWYSRDDEKETASHALLPLFYEKHGRGGLTVLTLPFGFRRAPDRNWWYVGPLFHRDTISSTFSMAAPLWFSHFNKATETRTRIVPPLLHYARLRPDSTLTAYLGLFWRHRTIAGDTRLALPLFYDINRFHQSRTTLLLPVFIRHRNYDEGSSHTFAPLFYRRSSPTDSTTVLFPLVWDFNSAERRTTLVLPFFAHLRRPNWTAKYIFPNIYYRSGLGPAAGTFRLFVFPFWESAAKRRGDYMWEVLLGLFGYERVGRNRFARVLFIPFELSPANPAQTAWYGGAAPPRPNRRRATGLDTRVW